MRQFQRSGLVFDVTDVGPQPTVGDSSVPADPVILLHGFPQDATCWSAVEPRLVAAGLRTLAPDQRGYSPSATPQHRSAYRLSELVADVLALLDATGSTRGHLVGHDWGGAVAWALAGSNPTRVASLTVLSTPHPAALAWALLRSDQALRSWYMLAMQAPWLPERLCGHMLQRLGADLGAPAAEHYRQRFATPASFTGPVNWYRANPPWGRPRIDSPARGRRPAVASVEVPTTFIWGRHDPYLGRTAALQTARHVSGDYHFVELDEGHWLPERQPDRVAAEIIRRVQSR